MTEDRSSSVRLRSDNGCHAFPLERPRNFLVADRMIQVAKMTPRVIRISYAMGEV